jgi:hypothetical protein
MIGMPPQTRLFQPGLLEHFSDSCSGCHGPRLRGHAVFFRQNMPTTSVGMAPKTLRFCETRSSLPPAERFISNLEINRKQ